MLYDLIAETDNARHAYVSGLAATRSMSRHHQKSLGQYMTPPPIARFMADRLVACAGKTALRILEPAAGSGVLAVAMVDSLLNSTLRPSRIELLAYELDPGLARCLEQVLSGLREKCSRSNVALDFRIFQEDFLLSPVARQRAPMVDIVIANPPYFKLSKQDERVKAHPDLVWGQPNIYGLFMGVCADLVRPGGRYCFITPRSWMSGPYFARVRNRLLERLQLDGLHVFDSRRDHFSEDEVLQEAVIVWGTSGIQSEHVAVSSSHGASDLDCSVASQFELADLLSGSADQAIRFPAEPLKPLRASLEYCFSTHGLQVSTGPVVAFRAADHLSNEPTGDSVPLLWLQHVRAMNVCWPIKKKREHIAVNSESAWMLLSNEPMVLVRRFSPKEEVRRVTAAPYCGELPGARIGVENHLNYIRRKGGAMTIDEARGLAAFLSSSWVSNYFDSVSGHTQVNATDLRNLPLPAFADLVRIGELVGSDRSLARADEAVAQVLVCAADIVQQSRHA